MHKLLPVCLLETLDQPQIKRLYDTGAVGGGGGGGKNPPLDSSKRMCLENEWHDFDKSEEIPLSADNGLVR
jgi:hypothetical protein